MTEMVVEGTRLEQQIVQELLGVEGDLSLYGLAVTVEKVIPETSGITETHLPRFSSPQEQELGFSHPRNSVNGSIQALDGEHNTLWLRPQRLTRGTINAGFLAVVGFVQDERPAYSVTVREPTWRDGVPSGRLSGKGLSQSYRRGLVPNLTDNDWARLQ